jgi:hypothetical protein
MRERYRSVNAKGKGSFLSSDDTVERISKLCARG